MPDRKRCYTFTNLQQAATRASESNPTRTSREQRCGQKQRQQEQKMIRAFGDVPHAEAEYAREADRAHPSAKVDHHF